MTVELPPVVEELSAALDVAEQRLLGDPDSPWAPLVVALVKRDRGLLSAYRDAVAAFDDPTTELHAGIRAPRAQRRLTLEGEVECAMATWRAYLEARP